MKREKSKNNFRKTEFLCPHCLSTLVVKEDFTKECGGDKLTIWYERFKKYETLTETEKFVYLNSFIDKDKFLELFDDWKKAGKLECDYSSKLYDIIPDNTVLIPDPLQLKRIELDLGYKLNESLLNEDSTFYWDGKKYYDKPRKGLLKRKLEWVRWPNEC